MFNVIPYYYCDEAGYKAHGNIALTGELSETAQEALQNGLEGGEFFIPADLQGLNIPELQDQLDSFPSAADHVWHVLDIGEVYTSETAPEGAVQCDAEAFLKAFHAVATPARWDVAGAMARLGL